MRLNLKMPSLKWPPLYLAINVLKSYIAFAQIHRGSVHKMQPKAITRSCFWLFLFNNELCLLEIDSSIN